MATTDLPHRTERDAGRRRRAALAVRAAGLALAGLLGAALLLVGVVAALVGGRSPGALAVDAAWAAVGLAVAGRALGRGRDRA